MEKEKTHQQGPTLSKLRAVIEGATHGSWRDSAWWKEIFSSKKRRGRQNLPIFGKFKRGRKSRDPAVIKQLANDESDDYR
jgi:hypothetical protein